MQPIWPPKDGPKTTNATYVVMQMQLSYYKCDQYMFWIVTKLTYTAIITHLPHNVVFTLPLH